MNSNRLFRIFGLALLLMLAACDDDDERPSAEPTPIAEPSSVDPSTVLVRLMHGVIDGPPLYPRIGESVVGGAGYGQASQPFQFDDNDERLLEVLYEGAEGEPVILYDDISVPVGDDRDVYVYIYGRFADPQVQIIDIPAFQVPTDDDGNVTDQYAVFVQFVAGFAQQPAVDIYLTEDTVDIATVNPTLTLSQGEVTPQVLYTASTGRRVRATVVGEKTLLYDSQSYTMLRARNTLYLLTDFFGTGETNFVLNRLGGVNSIVGTVEAPAELRVANFINNAEAVDLYFGDTNDAPEFDGVPFGTFSDYRSFEDQVVSVNVTPDDENLTFLHERELALGISQRLTLVVSGDAQGETDGVVVSSEPRPIANSLPLEVIHAAPSAGDVDLYILEAGETLANSEPVVAGLEYPANGSTRVAAGPISVIVTERGNETVLSGPLDLQIEVGFPTIVLTQPDGAGGPLVPVVLQERTLE